MQTYLLFGAVSLVALCGGCGNSTAGPAPESGFNTEPVSYEPEPNLDAVTIEIPLADPLELPDEPLPLPQPHVWTADMPIDFTGEIKTPPKTTGWPVRIAISPVSSGGKLGSPNEGQVVGRLKGGRGNIPYLLNFRAPKTPGRYRVTVQMMKPLPDLGKMKTFLEGDVEVKRSEQPRTK